MKVNYIGETISRLREARNLRQYELAEATGLSPSTICRYENGDREPGIHHIILLAEALGVPVATFFNDIKQGA